MLHLTILKTKFMIISTTLFFIMLKKKIWMPWSCPLARSHLLYHKKVLKHFWILLKIFRSLLWNLRFQVILVYRPTVLPVFEMPSNIWLFITTESISVLLPEERQMKMLWNVWMYTELQWKLTTYRSPKIWSYTVIILNTVVRLSANCLMIIRMLMQLFSLTIRWLSAAIRNWKAVTSESELISV